MNNLAWVNDPIRTVPELQAEAAARGLPTHGNRVQLRSRIRGHIATTGLTGGPPVPLTPVPPAPTPPTPPAPPAPAAPLRVTTTSPLRRGRQNERYMLQMRATGGTTPYEWSENDLPRGLTLNPTTGRVTGTPREDGTFHPEIEITDDNGDTVSQTFDLVIAARRPRTMPDLSWLYRPLLLTALGGLLAIVILLAGPTILNWVDNRASEFGNTPEQTQEDRTATERNRVEASGNTGNNVDDTLTIGGLEINNDGKYHNGISLGEIRQDVPTGYLVIGDATVNGHAPDRDSSTGQIVVLFEPAIVIGTNEASLQKVNGDNWQQAVKIKATEMRLNGCINGCATVIVRDQNGNVLDY